MAGNKKPRTAPVPFTPAPDGALTLPYGMAPAPAKLPDVTPPVDLGPFTDGEYAGWCVVLDRSVDVGLLAGLGEWVQQVRGIDDRDPAAEEEEEDAVGAQARQMSQVGQSMVATLEAICVAWNFTKTDAHGRTVLLPQPREGGARLCPFPLVRAISAAFGQAVKAPKAGGRG